MSSEQVTTALLDGIEPRFPKLIKNFNETFHQKGANGETLRKISSSFKEFVSLGRSSTSDGYCWFWILTFIIENSTVKIAIPWAQDWEEKNNIRLDRSIAVYADPQVPDIQLEQFISKLLIKFST